MARSAEKADPIRMALRLQASKDDKVPYGFMSFLAKEFNISRARVQQLAKELHISSRIKGEQV